MKSVELVKGISSSVLGFGCAPILGAVDATSAKRALDFAFDNGINHLDLARSYGYGDAEGFVGQLIKGKRQQMVIASKFGIKPNWKASLFNSMKPLLRALKKQKKKTADTGATGSKTGKDISGYFLDRIEPLRGTYMRASLEKSLKQLKTDYLDYYFIHEPHQTLAYINDLHETANRLKAEGKIRAWGIAYYQSQLPLHQAYINDFDLLQFNNSPGIAGYDKSFSERGAQPNIIFSPLSSNNGMTPAEKLKKILTDFPNSVVLCSMFNSDHLKQNISLIQ